MSQPQENSLSLFISHVQAGVSRKMPIVFAGGVWLILCTRLQCVRKKNSTNIYSTGGSSGNNNSSGGE